MISFKFNNINCYCIGPTSELTFVSEVMSYSVKGAYFTQAYKNGIWDGKFSFFHSKYNYFPTGLLPLAMKKLKREKVEYEIIDGRPGFAPIELLPLNVTYDLEDYQIEAMEALLKWKRGICEISTRAGKTAIGVACTQRLNLKTLFLVPTKDLLDQTKTEFKKMAGIDVGLIGDSKFDPKQVTVAIINTFNSRLKIKNEAQQECVEYLNSIQFLIIDEVHGISRMHTNVAKYLKNCLYRLGLSATVKVGERKRNLKPVR